MISDAWCAAFLIVFIIGLVVLAGILKAGLSGIENSIKDLADAIREVDESGGAFDEDLDTVNTGDALSVRDRKLFRQRVRRAYRKTMRGQ
jgi:uncharacterized membrane protein